MFFFFNETATTEIYTHGHTLSLHDALPILQLEAGTARPSSPPTTSAPTPSRSRLRADALHRAGHRRLRPQRRPRQPAQAPRGRPLLRRPSAITALAAEGKVPAKDVPRPTKLDNIEAEQPAPKEQRGGK